jgi:crossover junction endodeoxyribonuclease RuvC
MMNVIGIDPGVSGAVAFYNGTDMAVRDLPVLKAAKAKSLDVTELARWLDGLGETTTHAFIERVQAMPGQGQRQMGATSAFNFGRTFGELHGLIAAQFVPITLVTPQQWKKALGVPAEKDGARARASQLLPQHAGHWPLKKHDGRAEAALIALYGWRQLFREAA